MGHAPACGEFKCHSKKMQEPYDLYIIHDTSLSTRKENVEHIQQRLSKCTCIGSVVVIDNMNRKELSLSNVKNLLRLEKPDTQDDVELLFEKFQRPLSLQHVSNYLKHVSALERIAKSGRSGIVVEDDAIVSDDCEEILQKYMSDAKNQVEKGVVFFGQPFQRSPDTTFEPIKNFNDDTMTLLPSVDSYLVDPETAKAMIPDLLPIVHQTNIAFSLSINRLHLNARKMFPNAFIDGSKVGKFTSLINSYNILTFNSKYNTLYRMIQDDTVDLKKFDEIYASAEFNESPDMIYVKALSLLKAGDLMESKKLFDIAYNKYCEDNCSLNKSSSFMCNYLKFFKIFQT